MASNFFKVKNGIRVIPTTAPASPQEGDVYADSATKFVSFYLDGAWRDSLTDDQVQTISGKSFAQHLISDATGTRDVGTSANKFKDAHLSGAMNSATIATTGDAGIGGNLTVTGDLTVNGTTTTFNTATLDVEDVNVTVNKGGDNTTAQGAGLTVDRTGTKGSVVYDSAAASRFKVGDLGSEAQIATISHSQILSNKTIGLTNTVSLQDTEFTLVDNSDTSKVARFELSGITTSTTRTLTVPNADVTLVGTDNSQTLTNKTIVAANNTITTAASGNLAATSLDAALSELQSDIDTRALGSDLTTHTSDTTTHGTTGDIVGTSDTQTLTNKTITIKDTLLTLQDDGDATKQAKFNLSTITTGTTRTFSLPDTNDGIVVTGFAQQITNKTIDADLNTLSNIKNAEIKAGAAIAVNKLAAVTASKALQSDASGFIEASSVTNTELGYVSGVTSAIQTQIGNKADASTLSAHTGASTGVHGVTGSVVGTTDTQTLTNKTIGDAATYTQVATPSNPAATYNKLYFKSDNKLYKLTSAGTETEIGAGGGGGLSAWASSTVYAADEVVTYGKQAYVCITGHTSAATIEADIVGGKWRVLNTPTIERNAMLVGADFEDGDVAGWTGTGCATVTNGLPVSVGSGAAAFTSSNGGRALGANTSAPAVVSGLNAISGSYSLSLATTGAGTIGDGYISQVIVLDASQQAKVLTLKFDYRVSSGSPNMSGTSANTYAVSIYDVTNNAWLHPAGAFGMTQISGVGTCAATFQTASNTGNLQVFIYSPVAPTGASTLHLDNFFLGQIPNSVGTPVTDWTSYTPTGSWSTNTTYTGKWKRVGDSVDLEITVSLSGAPNNTALTINLPSGMTIDTAKLSQASAVRNSFESGGVFVLTAGSFRGDVKALYDTTTSIGIRSMTSGALVALSTTSPGTWQNGDSITVRVTNLPISGWSSQVQMSSDSDTRVVAANYNGTPTGTINTGLNIATFPTLITDTHSRYSGGVYSVPVSGYYQVSALLVIGGTIVTGTSLGQIVIDLDGSSKFGSTVYAATPNEIECKVSGIVYARAGQSLSIKALENSVTSPVFNGTFRNYLSINRLSGPATIAASEKVRLLYRGNAGTALTANTTNIDWATSGKVIDSHGVWSGTTFTAPRTDFYVVQMGVRLTADVDTGIFAYIDSSQYIDVCHIGNLAHSRFTGGCGIYLNAGQTLTFRSSAGATLFNDSPTHWLAIYSQG